MKTSVLQHQLEEFFVKLGKGSKNNMAKDHTSPPFLWTTSLNLTYKGTVEFRTWVIPQRTKSPR